MTSLAPLDTLLLRIQGGHLPCPVLLLHENDPTPNSQLLLLLRLLKYHIAQAGVSSPSYSFSSAQGGQNPVLRVCREMPAGAAKFYPNELYTSIASARCMSKHTAGAHLCTCALQLRRHKRGTVWRVVWLGMGAMPCTRARTCTHDHAHTAGHTVTGLGPPEGARTDGAEESVQTDHARS